MQPISSPALEALEESVRYALETGDETGLTILGYGEISTVLLVDTPEGRFACKRLPILDSREAAGHIASTIERYTGALREAGVDPIDNKTQVLEPGDGRFVLYSIQPAVPKDRVGPAHFRRIGADEAVAGSLRLFDIIERAVSPALAPDGQLSNWAFLDGRIVYLDLSTPFMRDEHGREILDWKHYAATVPAVFRPYFLSQVPKVMDKYHTLRGQIVDFIGNLVKEDLEAPIPGLIARANERFGFDPPITRASIDAYYRADAKSYRLLERIKRTDRWLHRNLYRKPYPYLLPPRISRNLP